MALSEGIKRGTVELLILTLLQEEDMYGYQLSQELQNNISDFLDKDSERTMEDVLIHFGPPEKFADEYILAIDTKNRQKMLHKAGQVRKTICIGISVMVLIIAVAAFMIVRENSRTAGYYYTDTITEQHDN